MDIIAPHTSHTQRDRKGEIIVADKDASVIATIMVIFTHVSNLKST